MTFAHIRPALAGRCLAAGLGAVALAAASPIGAGAAGVTQGNSGGAVTTVTGGGGSTSGVAIGPILVPITPSAGVNAACPVNVIKYEIKK